MKPIAETCLLKNAAKERKAEAAAFKEAYGTNKNGKNVFGKCVSAKQQQAAEPAEEPVAQELNSSRASGRCGSTGPTAFHVPPSRAGGCGCRAHAPAEGRRRGQAKRRNASLANAA